MPFAASADAAWTVRSAQPSPRCAPARLSCRTALWLPFRSHPLDGRRDPATIVARLGLPVLRGGSLVDEYLKLLDHVWAAVTPLRRSTRTKPRQMDFYPPTAQHAQRRRGDRQDTSPPTSASGPRRRTGHSRPSACVADLGRTKAVPGPSACLSAGCPRSVVTKGYHLIAIRTGPSKLKSRRRLLVNLVTGDGDTAGTGAGVCGVGCYAEYSGDLGLRPARRRAASAASSRPRPVLRSARGDVFLRRDHPGPAPGATAACCHVPAPGRRIRAMTRRPRTDQGEPAMSSADL